MDPILGNTILQTRLETLFRKGLITQSYLFGGPSGVGKFLVAKKLATLITQSSGQDVCIIEPEKVEKKGKTSTKSISVEQMREAQHFLSYQGVNAGYRVVIVREAESLSLAAQSVLLKTLEEPPVKSIIFLIVDEPGLLLPTVLSRVSEEYFLPVTEEELQSKYTDILLKEHNIPEYFRSLGSPGLLEQAIQDNDSFREKKSFLSSLFTITTLSIKDRLSLAEKLAEDKKMCKEVLSWWVPGLRAGAKKQNSSSQTKQYYVFLESVIRARDFLAAPSANTRLVLEELFLSLP